MALAWACEHTYAKGTVKASCWERMRLQARIDRGTISTAVRRKRRNTMDDSKHTQVSRRTFIGLGGVAGLGLVSGLAGCSSPTKANGESQSGSARITWRLPDEPITDIDETVEADIVIVGTGAAGSIALTTAIEAGASVTALQKESISVSHGLYNGGVDTIIQRAGGIDVDLAEWKTRWAHNTGNWGSIPHLNMWVKYSGPIINRLFALKVEEADCPYGPIVCYPAEANEDYWNEISPTEHVLTNPTDEDEKHSAKYLETFGVRDVAEWLTQRAIKLGADVRYKTSAVQLIRGDESNGKSGRVTGVIAKDGNGHFIKCIAHKAVILCAGGYSNNEEMKKELLPHVADLASGYTTQGNVGDAHKMATWIGAQMRRVPHTSNPHYDPAMGVPDFPGSAYPWLRVDLNGKRFSNEDMPYEQIYAQDMLIPENTHFQIFGDDYKTTAETGMGYSLFRFSWTFIPSVEQGVEEGAVYKADTIEKLAEQIGVPADALTKTVNRYNELAGNGYDEDFGKQASRLLPIAKAPYYAIKRRPALLDSMSGLMTNTEFQVLDEDNNVIEGLYAAGNCQSPFFGGFVQPMNICGMGTGRAFTTGHVAALRACGIEDGLWPTTDELIAEHPDYLDQAIEMESAVLH